MAMISVRARKKHYNFIEKEWQEKETVTYESAESNSEDDEDIGP